MDLLALRKISLLKEDIDNLKAVEPRLDSRIKPLESSIAVLEKPFVLPDHTHPELDVPKDVLDIEELVKEILPRLPAPVIQRVGGGGAGKKGPKGDDGAPGEDGAPGTDGLSGTPGVDGEDGYTPIKGVDYFDGAPGADGAPGEPGEPGTSSEDGTDGYTPVKGIDYFDGAPGEKGDKGDKGDPGEAYPVGAVFISVVNTNPNTLLGYGTWVAFGEGRVLVGISGADSDFDTVEKTGGAKTHTHPSHIGTRKGGTTNPAEMATGELTHNSPSHLMPYIVVYMWKRTA